MKGTLYHACTEIRRRWKYPDYIDNWTFLLFSVFILNNANFWICPSHFWQRKLYQWMADGTETWLDLKIFHDVHIEINPILSDEFGTITIKNLFVIRLWLVSRQFPAHTHLEKFTQKLCQKGTWSAVGSNFTQLGFFFKKKKKKSKKFSQFLAYRPMLCKISELDIW